MENLPPNLILKILEYLPINNRFKLRTISKQFKEIIDFKIPEKLILFSRYYSFNKYYPTTIHFLRNYNKYLDDNNLLIIKDEELFYSTYLFKFKRIKKLKSILNSEYLISADYYFNSFEELIELTILNFSYYHSDINLKLKKLKKFECQLLPSRNRLKLDTPSLIELKIEDLRNVDIIYPDKLLKLKIKRNINRLDITELFKFKNLEQLKMINYRDSMDILNRELIERLINLKKLIIIGLYLKQENKLNQIETFNYRRKNLEILINGLEIDQLKGFTVDNCFNLWIKSIIQNSTKINGIKLDDIIYHKLMESFNYELPTNFHSKITNVKRIQIDEKIEDESKLVNFIKKSIANTLYIETELSKSFYQQLNKENVSVNYLLFSRKSNLNLTDKESIDFIFNPKIRSLYIETNSLSSDFKFLTRSLIDYNLQYYSIRLVKYNDNNNPTHIIIQIYDDYFLIELFEPRTLNNRNLNRNLTKLIKCEFLGILNLMRQSFVDDELDFLKLYFLIDRINLINSSYTIMIKKLFKHTIFSKKIF